MANLKKSNPVSELEKLDELIEMVYQDLMKAGGRFKIMELLKAMEFKRKIAPPDDSEGAFWDMIDELRNEELTQSIQKPSASSMSKQSPAPVKPKRKCKTK